MVQPRTLRLKVEIDQEALIALEEAEKRFNGAAKALQETMHEVREAMFKLQDSLNVKRTMEDDESDEITVVGGPIDYVEGDDNDDSGVAATGTGSDRSNSADHPAEGVSDD